MRQVLYDRANARDEMNLAELPIFLLSTKQTRGVHERVFSRRVFDPKLKHHVHRKLTVTASAKYGLPTAAAEEVCLGLIHLTKAYNDFADPEVYFSRRDLLRTIGWKTDGPAYRRLTQSMNQMRYTGIKCENFWRDNKSKEYKSVEDFALIDSYDFRDRRTVGEATYEEQFSKFRWGQRLFESFEAGYLKKIDLRLALSFSPLGRRLYRLLDKRFNPPRLTRLVYDDLKVFAFECLGMSRTYNSHEIRRQLEKAIEELVQAEFLAPLAQEIRFPRPEGYFGQGGVRFDLHPERPRAVGQGRKQSAPRRGRPELRDAREVLREQLAARASAAR